MAAAVAAAKERNEKSEWKVIFMGTDSNLRYSRFQSFASSSPYPELLVA